MATSGHDQESGSGRDGRRALPGRLELLFRDAKEVGRFVDFVQNHLVGPGDRAHGPEPGSDLDRGASATAPVDRAFAAGAYEVDDRRAGRRTEPGGRGGAVLAGHGEDLLRLLGTQAQLSPVV